MAGAYRSAWAGKSGRHDTTLYQHSRVRWSQHVWYGPQRDLFAQKQGRRRGRQFELIAAERIFPVIGLTAVTHLADIVSSAPFDFVADYQGQRVVLDVTVKWQKRVDAKAPLASALAYPFYLLLVSPRDVSFYHFCLVRPDAMSVRVPFELLRRMAAQFGEAKHGRK